ncbi:ribosome small subunit-dependent GTPase A [Thermobrachium celere]|uniref:Small ribosomal subunit biogenesis GTPase RsgA n=1 Tax=Thermobrachium celere DSM 8682 TaxID=941824 RepID=R7RRH1_9CLOT|nr:ribosome small subunit-dependent GTPase A [Thermobrachium celere]GFR35069.1 putative ribosome biogenesis GTPase RsgA [Thermobrachium celere]CDF57893.1 Ribosome small subunit-stimulated GTPase EngC [Thermobrachium celere DSM 8682]
MQQGRIVRGIAGFYYVKLDDGSIIECKARGKFRKDKLSPIVGDNVIVEKIDEEKGVIDEILPRKNELIRPQVSNIDQALLVFALREPDISLEVLDRILVLTEYNNIEAVICFNKADLDVENKFDYLSNIYGKIGYRVIKTNAKTGEGIEEIKEILKNKTTVFAGPSGVGKSTMFNKVQNKVIMQTGEISKKVSRGKHTTRHAELIDLDDNTYLVDTPGFSLIDLSFIEPDELYRYFREFNEYSSECRFTSCLHNKEKDCRVKEMVEEGIISKERYENYIKFLNELQQNRRYK